MTRWREAMANRDRRGLTLVELMISLTVFGIVVAVVFGFMVNTRDSYSSTREKVQYQQGMRAAITLMTTELRSTGCDPTEAGVEPFGIAAATALQCRADLNGDGDVADTGPDETVTYAYNPGTGELVRSDGNVAMTILRGLQNLTFTYYDANGNVLGAVPLSALDRAEVRFVEVMMDGESERGEPVSYTARIALRNG
jgi:prepilin-type N-terminal cleavage/methylation domain-containing protein